MADNETGESDITLRITFTATGETEPRRAFDIARLIANYIEVEMDAAQVYVEVREAHLSYVEPYEARKAQVEQSMKDALS